MNDRNDDATIPEAGVGTLLDRIEAFEQRAAAAGHEAVDARVDAGRARIEALRMQAHLAGMEARDRSGPLLEELESRLAGARERLVELTQEANDVWSVFSEAFESARDELVAGEALLAERRGVQAARGG